MMGEWLKGSKKGGSFGIGGKSGVVGMCDVVFELRNFCL